MRNKFHVSILTAAMSATFACAAPAWSASHREAPLMAGDPTADITDVYAFVSYDATIPDDQGSREISRSTTKVGIELRLRISGGR